MLRKKTKIVDLPCFLRLNEAWSPSRCSREPFEEGSVN